MSNLDIRPAQEADLATIVDIYNDVMQTSSTIWSKDPVLVAERREWLSEASAHDHPILVALGSTATSASGPITSPFRGCLRQGLAFVPEHVVDPDLLEAGGSPGPILAGDERSPRGLDFALGSGIGSRS